MQAYEADYVTRDGQLVIDEPEVRAGLVRALDGYTALYRKGCVPPDAVGWDDSRQQQGLPRAAGRDDAERDAVDPERAQGDAAGRLLQERGHARWPSGADGRPLAIVTRSSQAVVFRAGGHEAAAKEFVRFLVGEGWLAHWLDFAGDRFLPPMPALLEQPFWLDPGDPHKMASAIQFLTQPRTLRLRGGLRRVAAPAA